MTADEKDSPETPQERRPDPGEATAQSTVSNQESPTDQHSSSDSIGRTFLILRLASFVCIISGLIFLATLEASLRGWVAWAAMGAFLAYLVLAGEVILRRTHGLIRRERQQSTAILLDRQAKLQEIASRDELTQLQNRRFFYKRLQEGLDEAGRSRKQISIAMIDVDDLKAINDEFGHQVGDVILRQFARTLNRTVGPDHVTARLGGDEFAVIMPDADRREADQLASKLWDELSAAPLWENGHASIYLGVSIGIGGYPWGGTDLEDVIHWADAKLFANKLERKGFNRGRTAPGDNRLSSAVVTVLSTALDIRDKMTHRHAQRVSRMAVSVAEQMGLSQQNVLEIEYAAALHDIGKIGVADSILRKAAPLDRDEWKDMRRHSELGYEILNGIDFLRNAAEIVWAHHERYDGKGYPQGLAREEIPLGARVFAVVDAYDAMTSRRPYRQAMSREQACAEIACNTETQFDPAVVKAFLMMIRQNPEGIHTDGGDCQPITEQTGVRQRDAVVTRGA